MTRNRIPHPLSLIPCLFLCVSVVLAAGCEPASTRTNTTESAQAKIVLESVPDDVGCIRVTVKGPSREVTRDLEVAAGQALVETLTGLPVGQVTFLADAYVSACGQVTKSTVPSWVGEEKVVSLALGRLSSVGLTLVKNGRAKVTVQFEDGNPPDSGARD